MRKFQLSVLALCLIATAMAKPAENQALQQVSEATNVFSKEFFEDVRKSKPGNLITSPLSANIVLAMASYGSGGNTEVQFQNVLRRPSPDTLGQTGYQNLIDTLNSVKDVELRLANKIFIAEKFNVKPSFLEVTKNFFRSASQSVNFEKSAEAAGTINSWVEENTNNRIKDLVSADNFDAQTALVLVNAVYFKGQWKNKFDPQLTKDMQFNVDENTKKDVPTMFRQGSYKYGELRDMNAKFIEIPYKGDELSMLIILPNEINGLAEVERKLQDTTFNDILSQGYERDVRLHLPKFKIESKIDLEDTLNKLGLTDMFTSHANFSGIADADLAVSKVVQKAFIEVNEEGSEAAAATDLIIILESSISFNVPPVTFAVDRPFFYSIVKKSDEEDYKVHGSPLFCGQVFNPEL